MLGGNMDNVEYNGVSEKEFMESYNSDDYKKPSVTVDIVVFGHESIDKNEITSNVRDLKVLLIKRKNHPYLGCWALPGGFVDFNETVGEAALRELKEETGLEDIVLRQLYVFSDPQRDPRDWVISCAHIAYVDVNSIEVKAGDDASEAVWFNCNFDDAELSSEVQEESNRLYSLILSYGDVQLSAFVKRIYTKTGINYEIVENQGLAFDHAMILSCALEYDKNRVQLA